MRRVDVPARRGARTTGPSPGDPARRGARPPTRRRRPRPSSLQRSLTRRIAPRDLLVGDGDDRLEPSSSSRLCVSSPGLLDGDPVGDRVPGRRQPGERARTRPPGRRRAGSPGAARRARARSPARARRRRSGTTTVSTSGASCSASSSPSVPWPARTSGSSKAWTKVTPPPRPAPAPPPTAVVEAVAGEHDLGAVALRRLDLRRRRVLRHEHGRARTPASRAAQATAWPWLPALAVTTPAARSASVRLRDAVDRAADLERAGPLEVLRLQPDRAAGEAAERLRAR